MNNTWIIKFPLYKINKFKTPQFLRGIDNIQYSTGIKTVEKLKCQGWSLKAGFKNILDHN